MSSLRNYFQVCKTAEDFRDIPISTLEGLIQSAGFFRNKARNIQNAARTICENFGGRVPESMDELHSLPGVGRKTANVVLGNAFHKPGLPVDTHVTRLANRIGLTKQIDAVKIETELTALIPTKRLVHVQPRDDLPRPQNLQSSVPFMQRVCRNRTL